MAITSYASRSRGGKGQEDMWAVANLCRRAGITTYNCMQAGAQENWKVCWFGKQPEAKLALVFLDEAYFESEGCVEELMAIIYTRQPFVPINFGVTWPFLQSDFLGKVYGSDATKMKQKQHTIRQFLGNVFPSFDQGFMTSKKSSRAFDGAQWEQNADQLLVEIRKKLDERSLRKAEKTAEDTQSL